jgi:hypothetical protein
MAIQAKRAYIIRDCVNCCCSIAFIFSCFFFWSSSISTFAACIWKAFTFVAQLWMQLISVALISFCVRAAVDEAPRVRQIRGVGALRQAGAARAACVADPGGSGGAPPSVRRA